MPGRQNMLEKANGRWSTNTIEATFVLSASSASTPAALPVPIGSARYLARGNVVSASKKAPPQNPRSFNPPLSYIPLSHHHIRRIQSGLSLSYFSIKQMLTRIKTDSSRCLQILQTFQTYPHSFTATIPTSCLHQPLSSRSRTSVLLPLAARRSISPRMRCQV